MSEATSQPFEYARGRTQRHRQWHQPQSLTTLPTWLTILAIVGICALVLPFLGMGNQVPWTRLPKLIATQEAQQALLLSLRTCVVATLIDIILGVPLALLLARDWCGVKIARVLVLLPLSLPPVVAGLALLATFGRRGLIGSQLQAAGITIAFSTAAVVIAQVFVSLPFVVTTVETAIRSNPCNLEETAAALGAGSTRVLTTITLPTLAPALARGTALAMARCLGEFGATITFAGSLEGVTRTMPLEVYLTRETDSDTALALGLVLVLVGALVVALTQWKPRHLARPKSAPLVHSTEYLNVIQPTPRSASVVVKGTIQARNWTVDLTIQAGQVVAVMGHNGAGKSTLAAVIGGILSLDEGQVKIGNRLVDEHYDPFIFKARKRHTIAPAHREVALLAQQPRIFKHMSVLGNVAYGPRSHRIPRRKARAIALKELAAVGCLDLAYRRGSELSGGQAARVALARALAVNPAVLILDEPTAALDVEATAVVHRTLRARLTETGTTAIFITHDIVDALSLASWMIVLDHGTVAEQGVPDQLLSNPRSPFTAQLAGLNLLQGKVKIRSDSSPIVTVGNYQLDIFNTDFRSSSLLDPASPHSISAKDQIIMTFPPEAVTLKRVIASKGELSGLPAIITGATESAALVTVSVTLDFNQTIRARITLSTWLELGLGIGDQVQCFIDPIQLQPLS